MAIRTLEIQKQGEGYVISEQAGSNYHKEKAVHQAPNREDAAHFLNGQGGPPDLVDQALDDAGATERVFLEIPGDYDEAEDFPKR